MTELLAQLSSIRVIELLVACGIVFLVDLRLRKMIAKQVQDGVAGALDPMTKAIGQNTDDIAKTRVELKEHFALISKVRDSAERAHDRLDAIGAPRVRAP